MITPVIMEFDHEVVKNKLESLTQNNQKRVHIDIGDGLFSELITIAPADLQQFEITKFEHDMHLLVDDPMEYVEECVALKPVRLIAQIERMGSQKLFVDTVVGYETGVGLALSVETPIEELDKEAIKICKTILLLAVPAGTSGSLFDERVLNKIVELKQFFSGSILIDGGINSENYKKVIEAGATEAAVNSSWWKGEWDEKS